MGGGGWNRDPTDPYAGITQSYTGVRAVYAGVGHLQCCTTESHQHRSITAGCQKSNSTNHTAGIVWAFQEAWWQLGGFQRALVWGHSPTPNRHKVAPTKIAL